MSAVHSIKVGIDFGTTYSGIAWAHTASPEKIEVIQRWPAGGNRNSDKVPSEIAYTKTGCKWGFQLPLDAEKLVWIKLLLEPTKQIQEEYNPLTETINLIPKHLRPVDVVADYLKGLNNHLIESLVRNFGEEFMKVTPIEYFLTVPAVWTDSAKALTLEAAELAGLGKNSFLSLISEPEAAAVCSLKTIQPNHLKLNEAFVVVDCGGGTVDLISYQIVALEPSLKVKECAVGTGGMCGSTYLNRRFEAFVRSRVGPGFEKMRLKGRLTMMKHFDEFLKRSFSDSEDDDVFSCPIPGLADNPAAGVEDGFFVLTREDMKDIFDPVIKQIIQLVQEQVRAVESSGKRKVSAILLVGGFGASEYLYQSLQATVSSSKHKIPILRPRDSWSAVVRGAVIRGLEGGAVQSIKARRSYGVAASRDFVEGVDPESSKSYDELTERWEFPYHMYWHVKKGDKLENKPLSLSFVYNVELDHDMIFTDTLEASDLDLPPSSLMDDSVYTVCTVTSDLSGIPKHKLKKRVNSAGVRYYHVDFSLVITMWSGGLYFQFEFLGRTFGNVTVEYS